MEYIVVNDDTSEYFRTEDKDDIENEINAHLESGSPLEELHVYSITELPIVLGIAKVKW